MKPSLSGGGEVVPGVCGGLEHPVDISLLRPSVGGGISECEGSLVDHDGVKGRLRAEQVPVRCEEAPGLLTACAPTYTLIRLIFPIRQTIII